MLAIGLQSTIPRVAERYRGILCDSFQHRSRLQKECWQHDSTQISTRPQLGDDMVEYYQQQVPNVLETFIIVGILAFKG